MAKHQLKEGESLVSVAKAHGYTTWKPIYDDPGNAALKSKRGHPNALLVGDELNIPDAKPKTFPVATSASHKFKVALGKGVWNLTWTPAKARCGDKVKLAGETNLPDGDLKLAMKTRELESPKLPASLTAKIKGGKFSVEWTIQDVQHLQDGSPPKAFAQVHVDATTADANTPCNVAALLVEAVADAAKQSFDAHRTWSTFSNHSHFDQRIEKFVNMVDVKLDVIKAWGATYIDMRAAGITGTAGGCPWAGYRWGRSTTMAMQPDQYWDGTAWKPLPAGFTPGAANYQGIGFYKSGSSFVSPSGGTWPQPFTDYDFNSAAYRGVRTRWTNEIHSQWTDKFWIRRDGCNSDKSVTCCRYGVDVQATFNEVTSYSTDVVLVAPGKLRSNAALWFMGDTRPTAAHETGHHMDNPDEYTNGAVDPTLSGDGAVNGIDTDCIMGQNMTKTKKRHYHAFVEMTGKLVNGATGRHDTFKAVDK